MIKILLADDHPIVTEGIEVVLEGKPDIEIVGAVHNGREVIKYLRTADHTIDVVILDIEMPDVSGLEIAHEIIDDKEIDTQVIFYSMHADEAKVKNAMKLEVGGYLHKGCKGSEIYEAVKTAYSGGQYYSKKVEEVLDKAKKLSEPTKREKEIIPHLDQGLSDKEIADKLFISTYTVSDHIKNLFRKYKANTRTELTYILRQKGLL